MFDHIEKMLEILEKIKKALGFGKKGKEITEQTKNEIFHTIKNNEEDVNIDFEFAKKEINRLKGSPFMMPPSIINKLLENKETKEAKIFRRKVKETLPQEECTIEETKFYINKFESWFGKEELEKLMV